MSLPNCWELRKCGRAKGGERVDELGECPASEQDMGHSCWLVAGTLCGGLVQGTFAQKEENCISCDVFRRYSRTLGRERRQVISECRDEEHRYQRQIAERIQSSQGDDETPSAAKP